LGPLCTVVVVVRKWKFTQYRRKLNVAEQLLWIVYVNFHKLRKHQWYNYNIIARN
jgi:hypothetical protein